MPIPEASPFADWARAVADRHTGVGGDGLIVLFPGARGPVRMRMWNADGSEGLLCLNGLRCAAKYAAEAGPAGDVFAVETASGDRPVRVFRNPEGTVEEVAVEVGRPDFRRTSLPAAGDAPELWGELIDLGERRVPGYGVSVGNPHLVCFLDSAALAERIPLEVLGERSRDPRFPEGVNVHSAAAIAPDLLVMKTWERGTGPTQACGSGAAAVYAAARRLGKADRRSTVRMPGGEVRMEARDDGILVLSGPAREVFRGVWTVR
jgi:diaminopimelate epimerase